MGIYNNLTNSIHNGLRSNTYRLHCLWYNVSRYVEDSSSAQSKNSAKGLVNSFDCNAFFCSKCTLTRNVLFVCIQFAIGDKTGVLQCLSIKDEEPVVQFKTLPGKPITSVQLASSFGEIKYFSYRCVLLIVDTRINRQNTVISIIYQVPIYFSGAQSDKIFAASGNEVKGYTKKGKVFLSIETSLTEIITSM